MSVSFLFSLPLIILCITIPSNSGVVCNFKKFLEETSFSNILKFIVVQDQEVKS